MAATRSHSLKVIDGGLSDEPSPYEATTIDVPNGEIAPGVTLNDGVLHIEQPDGGVMIDFSPDLSDPDDEDDEAQDDFYRNLASKIDPGELETIATDLLDAINRDIDSRQEWMQTRSRGITLLGLKLEDPRGDIGTTSAPLEGQSTVRHPLLLESTVNFQATAGGELLPATGPVKIRNDTPTKPKAAEQPAQPYQAQPMMGHNGGPPLESPDDKYENVEELASALETDMNHYLTAVATEYYPDTDRMLFYVGFGGDGFKKVYNCPLKERVVSESVDAEDLIVSNSAVSLQNCGRITHKIKMRKSVIRRMQILGAYRDVELSIPQPETNNPVEQKKADIQGAQPRNQRPEDRDYTIYETYCELELDKFAPKQFKNKGLPLPYRVTLERDSRKVLSVIRNWNKDDEQCLPKQFFVQFPFIRGLGFYGIGFIHLVGNTTNALTAAWREMLDAGMFANFPGFLYSKAMGRQLTNQMRVPPGGGLGLEIGAQQDIRAAVMPLPYKEPGPAFTSFVQNVEQGGQRLAATAQINVGEGKQDAPVGTTLALIEQATKVISAVHRRLHAAQAEEFKLIKDRFLEDPEAFWRHNKTPTIQWQKDTFVKALKNNNLVPVADPNNPTSLHRIAKATAVKELQKGNPLLYDAKAVDERIFRIVGIDPEGLFKDVPDPPPPDPRMEAIKQKAQSTREQQQAMLQDSMIKARIAVAQLQDKMQDRASREKIEGMKVQLEQMRFGEEQNLNRNEDQRNAAKAMLDMFTKQAQAAQQMQGDRAQQIHEMQSNLMQLQHDMQTQAQRHELEMQTASQQAEHQHRVDQDKHHADMARAQEQHEQKMVHADQQNEAKLAQAKALAAIQKKSKPKPKG